MEEQIVRDAWDWIGTEVRDFGVRWAVVAMFAFGFGGWFGKRYRDMKNRLAALEGKAVAPSISQTFIYNAAPEPHDEAREIQKAMGQKTVQGLQETMRKLPQEPLSNGHTLARLPEGTNIVSMADGSYRLALPVRLSGTMLIGSGSGSLSVDLKKEKRDV